MQHKGLYFDELGDRFDTYMSEYDVTRRIELMRGLLAGRHFSRALEVGCGTGKISVALRSHSDSLMVTDVSARLANNVALKLRCEGQAEDACKLSFSDESFDLVFSSECIEHTPDPLRALSEMARVLRPGGLLVVTTPNKLWYPVVWLSMALKIRKFEGYENWTSPAAMQRALEASNLRIEATTGCHLFPWQVPFSKRVLPTFDRLGSHLYPIMINVGIAATKISR